MLAGRFVHVVVSMFGRNRSRTLQGIIVYTLAQGVRSVCSLVMRGGKACLYSAILQIVNKASANQFAWLKPCVVDISSDQFVMASP